MSNEKSLKDALKYLVDQKGSGVLAEPIKLDAWLSDLVPQESSQIRLLVQASEDRHLDELSIKISEANAAAALSDCAKKYAYDQVMVLTGIFSEAFSLDPKKITPEKPGEKPRTPRPASPFKISDEGTLLAYSGSDKNIIIPDHVTSIGDRAYEFNTGLQTVVVPEKVRTIGEYAFRGCTQLRQVILPAGLQRINEGAFEDCTSLYEIALPAGLKYIGQNVFGNCQKINGELLFRQIIASGSKPEIKDYYAGKIYDLYADKKTVNAGSRTSVSSPKRRKNSLKPVIIFMLVVVMLTALAPAASGFFKQKSAERSLAKRDWEAALPYYRSEYRNNPYKSGNETTLTDIYVGCIDSLVSSGNTYLATQRLNEAKNTLRTNSCLERLNGMDTYIAVNQNYPDLKEKLRILIEYVDSNDFKSAGDYLDEIFAAFSNENADLNGLYPLVFALNGRTYKKAVVSISDTYQSVYYGECSGLTRQGHGFYLFKYSDHVPGEYYWYEGEWSDDYPNGPQEYQYSQYDEYGTKLSDYTRFYNTINGLYDGEVKIIDNINGLIYKGSFDNGKAVSLGHRSVNVIGDVQIYAATDDGEHWWYYSNDPNLEKTYGMYGY